ncbi:hypothetical protein PH586_07670 [Pseudomonas sp. SA3-5]|uniref:Uncharacterized protein n=1 Tax=Pseudomonas aestuarii TaxID=3018340 RepID=A0ABT4XDF6_9PSED|nr:hypothetical protein [Pseudomonas aestuarii]MDA7086253.1 hypothetical protein [Pseudomonas aestuarii]
MLKYKGLLLKYTGSYCAPYQGCVVQIDNRPAERSRHRICAIGMTALLSAQLNSRTLRPHHGIGGDCGWSDRQVFVYLIPESYFYVFQ